MVTVTFDTLHLVNQLKAAGFEEKQAESIVRVITMAQEELVTKAYLDSKLEKELAPVRTDLAVLKWMMGVLLAGVVSLVLKAYF